MMRTHLKTCWVIDGDTLGNAQALVNTVAETVQESEKLSVGDTRGGAEALVDALADTLAEVEALTTGDTLGNAHALNDLLGEIGDTLSKRSDWSTRWLTRYQRWRSCR